MNERNDNGMFVRFWGVRGSIPTPTMDYMKYGGNTSCVELRCGEHILIFDAGTGIKDMGLSLINEYGSEPYTVNLFISHTHWDHIQGFPFFNPVYMKNVSINIYGGHFYSDIKSLLERQMEKEYFPVSLNEVSSRIQFQKMDDNPFLLNDEIKIYHTHLLHPTLSLGFRVEYNNRVFVYATDNELIIDEEIPDFNEKNINNLFINADVLIADSQYTLNEYSRKIGWGHSSVEKVIDISKEFGVKNLYLYHHDPYHSDAVIDKILNIAKKLSGNDMRVHAARERVSFSI